MRHLAWKNKIAAIFLTVFLLAALAWNSHWLWKAHAWQVSGDTLIHLIFARNFIDGRLFEFNLGEPSRALTSLLWNGVLVGAGAITGLAKDNDGFLNLARLLSVLCFGVSGVLVFRLAKKLGATPVTAGLGVVVAAASPITYYWGVTNPMETGLAVLLILLYLTLFLRFAKTGGPGFKAGLAMGGMLLLLTLNRPEMVVVGSLGAAILFFWNGARRWWFATGISAIVLLGAALWVVGFEAIDLGAIPNANSARRTMLLMNDTIRLPGLGIPFSGDVWLLVAAHFPLVVGLAAGLWKWRRREEVLAAGFCLAALGFALLFFSFYFPTTWQGRYLLPFLFLALPVALAGLEKIPKVSPVMLTLAALVYTVPVSLVILKPLAAFADAPRQRALATPVFWEPKASDKTVLCNEVQGAYFLPQLRFISSEGLITPEALQARARGLSALEFVKELRPDLVAVSHFPLRDPDGLDAALIAAAQEQRDFAMGNVQFRYLGLMAGCGPVFRPAWE